MNFINKNKSSINMTKMLILMLMFCFAFVPMNAQQSNSDNNDQPVNTADAKKNTYVADSANSDNGDVAPEDHVSKNTYVAPKVVDNDGVKKVADKKATSSEGDSVTPNKDADLPNSNSVQGPSARHDGTTTVQQLQDVKLQESVKTNVQERPEKHDGTATKQQLQNTKLRKSTKTNVQDRPARHDGTSPAKSNSPIKTKNN